MATLILLGHYIASKVGKTGLTDVTIDLHRITQGDASVSEIVTAGACTAVGDGAYLYRYASADLATYVYVGVMKTADATVDQQHIPVLGIVIPDELTSTRLATSGYTAPPSASTVASQVRTELTTELARVDVTISSRNATTPPTASAIASQVRTELTTELTRLDGTVTSRLASAGYTAPLDAAGTRTALGLATANLDTQLAAIAAASGLTADEVKAAVWTAASRTLTSTAAATTAAVAGATLTVTQATSYAATLTGLTIPAAWTKCWLTVKRDTADVDNDAVVQLLVSNPGVGTDGLQRLNGAAATAGQGSLVVTQAAGTLAIALSDAATVNLTVRDGLLYDVKVKTASGTQVLTSGTLDIAAVVTLART